MSPKTAAARTEAEITRALGSKRRQIDRTKAKLDTEFGELNALYVEGDAIGMRATDMARAIGTEPKKIASASENIRQIVAASGVRRYAQRQPAGR